MRKLITLAMGAVVLGPLLGGCGSYLAHQKQAGWANSVEKSGADMEKFSVDHGNCVAYAAAMINIPFADGLGLIPSTSYYNHCMRERGYRIIGDPVPKALNN